MKAVSTQGLKDLITKNKRGETRLYLFMAFVIPFLLIWGMFIYFEVHPFGDKQILVVDLWHQYFPFFQEEQLKLKGGESLLYSWHTGLGTNFLSIMSYYAASPLNLLSLLFPMEYSRDAMTLFLTFKIGFAGMFFAYFLKRIFGKNDWSIAAFGVFYALCSFVMGYYWNLIWMDTFALLPLLVTGTVLLVKEGRFRLYVISLALSLISNFYIGFFSCIFTAMVFIGTVIINWKGFKNALIRLGQIAAATAVGAGIGAVILIPTALALSLTVSAGGTFPQTMTFYDPEWLTMISGVIGFHEPTSKEGMPNFYCGMLALILLGVFIVNRRIKIREKIITVLYLAFIVVSCNMNILNYMWHGFHFTNQVPYRFAFLFSFLLLAAAYRAYTVMSEGMKIFDLIAMLAMVVAIALVSYNYQAQNAVIISIAVCFVYIAVMFVYYMKAVDKRVMDIAVCVICAAEMGWNAYIGVNKVTVTTYSIYPNNYSEVKQLLDERDDPDKSFYRTEFDGAYTINDPALYSVKGVSQFSSTANVNVTRVMEKLGIQASEAGNRYYYTENTPVFNSLFGIRYLITQDGKIGDNTYLEEAKNLGVRRLYENKNALPAAFAADADILNYSGASSDPAVNQNMLFRKALGTMGNVFERVNVKDVGHKGLNVTKLADESYTYQYEKPSDGSSDCYLKYNFTVPKDGPLYAAVFFDNMDGNKFRTESGKSGSYDVSNIKYKSLAPIGTHKAGDVVTVYIDIEKEKSGRGEIYVYSINDELFREGIEKLRAGGLDVTDFDSTSLEGTIKAEKDCVMFTSIPYDGGWTAYVDGEKTEVRSVDNALCAVPIKAGSHDIKLKYAPPGFAVGLTVTIVSLAAFAALWFVSSRLSRKKAGVLETQVENADEGALDEPAGAAAEDGTDEKTAENTEAGTIADTIDDKSDDTEEKTSDVPVNTPPAAAEGTQEELTGKESRDA